MRKLFAVQIKKDEGWDVCQTFVADNAFPSACDTAVACIYCHEEDALADMLDWKDKNPDCQYRVAEVTLYCQEP